MLGAQHAAQFLAEIWRRTFLVIDSVEVQFKRESAQRVKLGLGNHILLIHLLKHHVAAVACALRLTHRIVVGGVFDHSDQSGSLLDI